MQPSQFLIDRSRLTGLEQAFDSQRMEPIPVQRIDGQMVMLDGHHRACALLRRGADRLPVVEDDDDSISLPLYRVCVAACRARGVVSARDLTGCIVSPQDFERDWNGYCDDIQAHEGYAIDPCGYAALPMWKQRHFAPPAGLRVLHVRDWAALSREEQSVYHAVQRFSACAMI